MKSLEESINQEAAYQSTRVTNVCHHDRFAVFVWGNVENKDVPSWSGLNLWEVLDMLINFITHEVLGWSAVSLEFHRSRYYLHMLISMNSGVKSSEE